MAERTSPRDQPPHGTLAEEAAKLAEVAQQWLGERQRAAARDVWAEATAPRAGEGAECTGCPLCRARRLLVGVSPEVLGYLSSAASSLGAALRAAGRTAAPDGAPPASSTGPSSTGPSSDPPSSGDDGSRA